MDKRDIIFIPGKAFWCAATGIDIRKEGHSYEELDILLRYLRWEMACYNHERMPIIRVPFLGK